MIRLMVLIPPAKEQHGDDAQRDEQADGGPVVEQLRRPGEARRGAAGVDRLASLGRCGDPGSLTGRGGDRRVAGGGIVPLFWSS